MRRSQGFITNQLVQLCLLITLASSSPLRSHSETEIQTTSWRDATLLLKKALQSHTKARIRRAPFELPSYSRVVRLVNFAGGLIGIGPGDKLSGMRSAQDPATYIQMQSIGRATVRFRGKQSGRYIAFRKNGKLYTTLSVGKESLFKEVLEESFYHTYESIAFPGFFLGFKRTGLPKKGNRTSRNSKSGQFQTVNTFGR